jgi:hypothetical protein
MLLSCQPLPATIGPRAHRRLRAALPRLRDLLPSDK